MGKEERNGWIYLILPSDEGKLIPTFTSSDDPKHETSGKGMELICQIQQPIIRELMDYICIAFPFSLGG